MAGSASTFLDTNVVLRYNVVEAPYHSQVRSAVERLIDDGCQIWINRQVLREFSVTLTRPQTDFRPLTCAEVAERIRAFPTSFWIADETFEVTQNLLVLMDKFHFGGKQVHDANIVATMQAYGVARLFTLNSVDFQSFSELVEILTLEEVLRDSR